MRGIKGSNRANSLTLDVLYPEVSDVRKSLLRNYNLIMGHLRIKTLQLLGVRFSKNPIISSFNVSIIED